MISARLEASKATHDLSEIAMPTRSFPVRCFSALTATFISFALVAMTVAPAASAEFGFEQFDGQVANLSGDAYTQAGGHPEAASVSFALSKHTGELIPGAGIFTDVLDGDIRDMEVSLPAGFVGNPMSTARCLPAVFEVSITRCPRDSIVGILKFAPVGGSEGSYALVNLTPPPGVAAAMGAVVSETRVRLLANLRRENGEYRIAIGVRNLSQVLSTLSSTVTIWGVPGNPTHDNSRCPILSDTGECSGGFFPMSTQQRPAGFLVNPTACSSPGKGAVTSVWARSWQEPERTVSASFESHLPPGYPLIPSQWGPPQGVTGCERVPFDPSVSVAPTSRSTDSPTGLEVRIEVPQDGLLNPTGIASGHLRRAEISLPEGVSVNAASADGLGSCSPEQIGLENEAPVGCPDSSKLATATIRTPLLDEELSGAVYLAEQGSNPFSSLLALYLVAESSERGVRIKLAGKVTPDPVTGRLTAVFDNNPQLPFESLELRFASGDRAALATPKACGTYATDFTLTSWSGRVASGSSRFTIDQNCNASGKFTPGFAAGTTNPIAGAHSPFTLRVTRPDGQQNVASIQATLPEGVLAKLAGVPLCPEGSAASGNCPGASQVGTATVGAGAGSNPLYVPQPGKSPTAVYLAGPYKGAPYSLVAKVPAQAGPFDLGTVTVRNTINVDPTTAQVSVKSDPLPQILQGIPIAYRDIRVNVDKPQFTLNPTSCDPMEVKGTIGSSQGAEAKVADRFQVANCANLAFKPSLKLSVKGPTHRSAHPRLKAVLTMPNGGANIEKAQVTLPKTEFLENAHIRTICTRVQYAAQGGGGKACPPASVYGKARAFSPLLDKPLEGPVFLRSSNNPLPDLVASLDGQIHVDLVGRIDAVNARIRNTFEGVPDAPVSKFVLEMQGGKKGLLVNNTELCKTTPRATVKFDGQNGKLADSSPEMRADCGKKAKKKGSGTGRKK